MSYLEMKSAPLPDMSSGIISIWFRDVSKQPDAVLGSVQPPPNLPPEIEQWPQGFWTVSNANTIMVPPNAQYSVQNDPDFGNSVFFYNPYGMPIGGDYFGSAFLGAASVWIPNSPPVPLNTMTGNSSGIADVDMSPYGVRTLLAFGDPDMDYQYCTWRHDRPDVIPAVQFLNSFGFIIHNNPPPYRPYNGNIGDHGKFYVTGYRINSPAPKGKVPQSFIGVDNDGHLVINLQTKTKATFKGMAYEYSNWSSLMGSCTSLIIDEPHTYSQIGFPFPDGHWESKDGYWNGYKWEARDISGEVMGCAPESFLIYSAAFFLDFANGPIIHDGGWHHLLFAFDISGAVTVETTDAETTGTTTCKAWLAFDDNNFKGDNLQNRPRSHDGFVLPKLRGTQSDQILDCGPCTTFARDTIGMGENDILPRNAWIRGFSGKPEDGITNWAANVGIISDGDDTYSATGRKWGGKVGDFNWMDWTGPIWPLYGHGVAPGPWQAVMDPPKPPGPQQLDHPKYQCGNFVIPVHGHPIGIPCSSNHLKHNTGLEMAELQIWANKTIDTGNEEDRRLFIDYPKKEDGTPDKSKPLQPVPPAVAAAVLGRPDVLLHGAGNWQVGKNTGTSGVDEDGNTMDDGQFEPVAKIYKFKPEPKLGK
jgi:hypothetical protein